jgi:hypothetical protein
LGETEYGIGWFSLVVDKIYGMIDDEVWIKGTNGFAATNGNFDLTSLSTLYVEAEFTVNFKRLYHIFS